MRPELSLENEIVNHFSHITDGRTAGVVKRVIKELSVLYSARGQKQMLDTFIKENPSFESQYTEKKKELENFILERTNELNQRYRMEEIKGT